jgi:hypothetical protein
MILKISTSEGWKFYDNIKEILSSKKMLPQYNEEVAPLNKKFYANYLVYCTLQTDGRITKNMPSIVPVVETGYDKDTSVIELVPTFRNGETEIYIADCAVYLLADDGKTIEKIN